MKALESILILAIMACGCSKNPPTVSAENKLPPRLDSYFEIYCDETSNQGIGFSAWDTYDFQFRQHLKMTKDPELKRLFVLQNLHREVEGELHAFKAGIVLTGVSSERPLTSSEWKETRSKILTQINDLTAYVAFTNFVTIPLDPQAQANPELEKYWLEKLRNELFSVTNSPKAN